MKFCSYDAEGDAGDTGLLGVAIASDTYTGYLTDKTEILTYLREHAREGYTLISHNAQYDIPVVFWQLHQDVRCIYYNNKFNHGIWLYGDGDKTCKIWDSLGLSGGVSLAQLGKAIGLPKLKTPQKLLGNEPDKYNWKCEKHDVWECEECYAVRDAEIVLEYMKTYTNFLSSYQIPPKRTIGSASVAIWKKLNNSQKVHLPFPQLSQGHKSRKLNPDVECSCKACSIIRLSRQSYFGGRVDCFKVGTFNNIYTADVTSMYPYIMSTQPMPNPEDLHYVSGKGCKIDYLQYEGVTECTVFHPDTYVPILPYAKDNKLLFPVGTFTGTWCNCELRKSKEMGVIIIDIKRQTYSTSTVYPFITFVSTLMELRTMYKKQGDARQQTVKIILNSLYGRIGIKEAQTESTLFLMPYGKTSKDFPESEIQRTPLGPAIIQDKHHYRSNPYANVMWASHITAYARLHLYNYLIQQGNNVVYCDTDSVYSLSPIIGTDIGLGMLTDTGLYDMAHIIGPKLYSLELSQQQLIEQFGNDPCEAHDKYACERCFNIWKAKGVPKRAAMEYLQEGKVKFDRPAKPREAIVRGLIAGKWYETPKQRRLELTKRHTLDVGAVASGVAWSDTAPLTEPSTVGTEESKEA